MENKGNSKNMLIASIHPIPQRYTTIIIIILAWVPVLLCNNINVMNSNFCNKLIIIFELFHSSRGRKDKPKQPKNKNKNKFSNQVTARSLRHTYTHTIWFIDRLKDSVLYWTSRLCLEVVVDKPNIRHLLELPRLYMYHSYGPQVISSMAK